MILFLFIISFVFVVDCSTSCFGILDGEAASVCSGHGTCISNDTCECSGDSTMYKQTDCSPFGFEFLSGHDSVPIFTGDEDEITAMSVKTLVSNLENTGFYVIGGQIHDSSWSNEVWFFSIGNKTWNKIFSNTGSENFTSSSFHADNQIGVVGHAGSVKTNTSIVMIGGYSGTQNLGKMYEFSFELEQFRRLRDDTSNVANSGTPGQYGSSTYISNSLGSPQVLYLPERFSILILGGQIFIANGVYSGTGSHSDVWEYSIELNQFRFLKGTFTTNSVSGTKNSGENTFDSGNYPPKFFNYGHWRLDDEWYIYTGGYECAGGNEMWILDINSPIWKYRTFLNDAGGGSMVKGEFDSTNCPGAIRENFGWSEGAYFYALGGCWNIQRSSIFVYSSHSHQWMFIDGRTNWDDNLPSNGAANEFGGVGSSRLTTVNEVAYIFVGYGKYGNDDIDIMDSLWSYTSPYICYDVLSNNSTIVCSGHGNCTYHDTCECYERFNGTNCDICEPNYIGSECDVTSCNGIYSNQTSIVCSGHGTCESYETCVCYDSSEYYGTYCGNKYYFQHLKGSLEGSVHGNFTCNEETSSITGRSRSGGAVFGSLGVEKFYIFGGYGSGNSTEGEGHLSDLWAFDIQNGNWCFLMGNTEIDVVENSVVDADGFHEMNFPGARSGFSVFATTFSMFSFGGTNSGNYALFSMGNVQTNELWEFSIIEQEWRMLFPKNNDTNYYPSVRTSSCAAKKFDIGKNMMLPVYLFGGGNSDGEVFNDAWKFSIYENSFEKLHNGTDDVIDVSWNSTLFFTEIDKNEFNESIVAPSRYSHVCWVGNDDMLYIFGGTLRNEKSSNDVWIFNTTSYLWSWIHGSISPISENIVALTSQYDSLNMPCSRSSSIVFLNQDLSDGLMFFGGVNKLSEETFADVWAFQEILRQFKFVNGSIVGNVENSAEMIGSRYSGVACRTLNENYLIFGGEGL